MTGIERVPAAHQGTIALDFRAVMDGTILRAEGELGSLELRVEGDHLVFQSRTADRDSILDAEDTGPLADGTWHSAAISVDVDGTRVFLDGYQVFCGTQQVFLGDCGDDAELSSGSATVEVARLVADDQVWTPQRILQQALAPTPVAQFAANRLSAYDVDGLADLAEGTIEVRFRVRGRGQGGTLVAAGGGVGEQLRLRVADAHLIYEVQGRGGQWRSYQAAAEVDDGGWHDVAVRVGGGAVDLYADGYRVAHHPGGGFFCDVESIKDVVVGQDCVGSRLWGEASRAAIYARPLNDQQLKRRCGVPPMRTTALFDRGYEGSASYRIPTLAASPGGVLIAGCDQRTGSANDSPNHINFVVRRSFDNGLSWEPLQRVITSYGSGPEGASMIDGCLVSDFQAGRVVVVIDHFPGGVGQPNNEVGTGMTADGELLLVDEAGVRHVWANDGRVLDEDGEPTRWTVEPDGSLRAQGNLVGNVFDARGPLLTERTCYLMVITSDDDGETWSEPRHINHQVKADWMRFCGTAPGTGIQLRHGAHAGRLLVPIYFEGDHPKRVSTAVIMSDDHGETWRRGGSPNDGRVLSDGTRIESRSHDRDNASLHESTVVETANGDVLLLMRNQHPSGRVLASRSSDGGESWGAVEVVDEIPEIFCQPNAIALGGAGDELVFVNACQMLPFRGNGVVRRSHDGGRTWPWARTVNPGHHVYQSLAETPDGHLLMLWENEWQGLYLSHIPQEWLG